MICATHECNVMSSVKSQDAREFTRDEEVDVSRGIKFSLMPLVLAGLMCCLSRGERLRVNAQRSDLREDFLVSWLTQLCAIKISFKTLARASGMRVFIHYFERNFFFSRNSRCTIYREFIE